MKDPGGDIGCNEGHGEFFFEGDRIDSFAVSDSDSVVTDACETIELVIRRGAEPALMFGIAYFDALDSANEETRLDTLTDASVLIVD